MFLAKNQQLSDLMPMGKQQTPPLEQPIFVHLLGHQQTQTKLPIAVTMTTRSKGVKWGQMWHHANETLHWGWSQWIKCATQQCRVICG